MASLSEISTIAKNVLKTNMGMTRNCNLFVLYDDSTENIAEAYVAAGRIIQYPNERLTAVKIEEKDRPLDSKIFYEKYVPLIDTCFDGADDSHKIALTPTKQHPEETNFRIHFIDHVTSYFGMSARHKGRLGHQPGINNRMMTGPMAADYRKIAEDAEELLKIMREGNMVNLTDGNGSFIRIKLPSEDKYWEKDDGMLDEENRFGNLPAGELFCDPEFGFTEGVLIFNSVTGIGVPNSPVKLTVKDGMVTKFETKDEEYRKKLETEFYGTDKQRFTREEKIYRMRIGELGIGLNPMARLYYNDTPVSEMLEAEKVLGTVHIATGEGKKNPHVSKECMTHNDYLITNPTLKVDGKFIIKDGKHVWKENF